MIMVRLLNAPISQRRDMGYISAEAPHVLGDFFVTFLCFTIRLDHFRVISLSTLYAFISVTICVYSVY